MKHFNSKVIRVILPFAAALVFLMGGCQSKPKQPTVVKVIAKKYEFVPNQIHVKAGETIQFEVSTPDVQHGFSVPDLKIDESIQPGKPAIFTHVFDQKGTYSIECSVICGPHHDDMRAALIVE